jgi:hypothetical protein
MLRTRRRERGFFPTPMPASPRFAAMDHPQNSSRRVCGAERPSVKPRTSSSRIVNGPRMVRAVAALGLGGSDLPGLSRQAGGARLRPPRSDSDDDLEKVSADALGSVENDPYRRDDSGQRRLALPIRGVAVASLIQPMGRPVNGSEPFWTEGERRPCCRGAGRP